MNHAGRRWGVRRATIARACVALAMVGGGLSGCSTTSPTGSVEGSIEPSQDVGGASASPLSPDPVRASFVELATGRVRSLPRDLRILYDGSNYRVAPDGSSVVFDGVAEEGPQLFLGDLDGGPPRQLTQEPIAARQGTWSPDGSKVVYVAGQLGMSLRVIDVTSGTSTTLVDEGRAIYRPSVASGGRTVLFTQSARNARGGWRTDLWTVPIGGGTPERLIRNGAYGEYSPDGSMIAYQPTFTAGPHAYCGDCWWVRRQPIIVPADGSEQPGPNPGGNLAPALSMAGSGSSWSPDGTSVVFTGWGTDRYSSASVYLMVVQTRRIRELGEGRQPTWFDDGTLIVTDYREDER